MTPLASPTVQPQRGELPVLLSVPHSGRDYPDWLVGLAGGGRAALASLEDPLVDRLAWRALGRGGLGIVPARTPHHGYLWRRAVTAEQLEARLEQAYRPFHRAIEDQLALILDRFGCALLLDCHSMPPPPAGVPPIVFGDRHGRTAEPWLSMEAMDVARECGFPAGLNDPFAGGHVIERHGVPQRGVQALQVEIDRAAYLDARLREPGPGFDRTAMFLETLAVRLGTALLGRRFATAAE